MKIKKKKEMQIIKEVRFELKCYKNEDRKRKNTNNYAGSVFDTYFHHP